MTSFTYLKTLPVDFLKIGGHLVKGVAEDPVYGSIIGAISQIGRTMGIQTIAKNVGPEPTLETLRALGVGFAQGLALRPPEPLTSPDGHVLAEKLQQSA